MFGLEHGNSVLKEIHKELTLERVEKIMDDSAEGIAYQQEISDMLSQNISNADELAVQEELEALEKEEIAKRLPAMPNAPNKTLVKEDSKETEPEEQSAESDTEQQPVLA